MGKTLVKRKKSSKSSSTKKKWAKIVGQEYSKPELKNVDVNDGGGAPLIRLVSTTATIDYVNGTSAGSNDFQRVGRSAKLHSIHFKGGIYPSGNSGTTAGEWLRILLVYDRQPNGAVPSYSDIMQTVDATGNFSSTAFDFKNLGNAERFLILRDHNVQVPCTSSTTAGTYFQANQLQDPNQSLMFDDYVKLENLPVQYKGVDASISSIATGALYVVTCGSQAVASAGCTLNYVTRVMYSDA